MGSPIDIRDVLGSSAELREARTRPVKIAVLIDAHAPEELVAAVRESVRPQSSNAYIRVEPVITGAVEIGADADAVIAVAGDGRELEESVRISRLSGVPTIVLGLGDSAAPIADRLGHPLADTRVSRSTGQLMDELGVWLAGKLEPKRIALAAGFGFVRRAVAEESVKATAFQNAALGAAVFLPGADMPIMTANQVKMVLQIAAAYGEPLGAERIKELVAVLGGAFLFRGIARQVVGFVPGVGWALKGAIGYTGTLAMGYAAIRYFEAGGDPRDLAKELRGAAGRLRAGHREGAL